MQQPATGPEKGSTTRSGLVIKINVEQCSCNLNVGSADDRYEKLQKVSPVSYTFISSKQLMHECLICASCDISKLELILFTVYIVEIILRVIGHGPYGYFRKKRNM